MEQPQWLIWARRLQAIAQTGLTYTQDDYDRERYHELTAIAGAITESHSDLSFESLTALFEAETGYPTPKVDVRAVIFDGPKLLLVKERSDGLWTLPGGWADVNEAPSEAVAREVLEEAGYQVKPTRLLAVYDRSKHAHVPVYFFHIYKMFFECEILDPDRAESAFDIEDVAFFSPDGLPPLSLSRTLPSQIARLVELHADAAAPTDFD